MNNASVEKEVREFLSHRGDELPESVEHKLEQALLSIRNNRKRKAPMRYAAVAAGIAALAVAGTAMLAPTDTRAQLRDAVKGIPVLGSLFDMLGDNGLDASKKLGYVATPNTSVTDQGITLLLKEVAFDGVRFKISYEAQTDKQVFAPNPTFFVNGEKLEGGLSASGMEKDGVSLPGGVIEFSPAHPERIPNEFKLDLVYNQVFVRQPGETNTIGQPIKGNWDFTLPVKKANAGERQLVFRNPPSYKDAENDVIVKSFTKSASVMTVELDYTESKAHFAPQVMVEWNAYDDQGNPLTGVGAGVNTIVREDDKSIHLVQKVSFQPNETGSITLVRKVHYLKEVKPGELQEQSVKEFKLRLPTRD